MKTKTNRRLLQEEGVKVEPTVLTPQTVENISETIIQVN